MFKHAPVSLPEIKAKTTDGVRLYETPEGNKYPSITTVLSVRNKQGLFEWRKRVGEDVANHIASILPRMLFMFKPTLMLLITMMLMVMLLIMLVSVKKTSVNAS